MQSVFFFKISSFDVIIVKYLHDCQFFVNFMTNDNDIQFLSIVLCHHEKIRKEIKISKIVTSAFFKQNTNKPTVSVSVL